MVAFLKYVSSRSRRPAKKTIDNEQADKKQVDEWAERIATIEVGAAFRARQPGDEDAWHFKRRIGAAARLSFRKLKWFPEGKDLPAGPEPKTYLVRINAMDWRAKRAAEARRQRAPVRT